MRLLSFFLRHPHPIYFSIEKLFHAIAREITRQARGDFDIRESRLPFTSKLSTIFRNISFVRKSQTRINHITGDIHYCILGCRDENINVLTIHDCVLLHHYSKANPRHWIIRWLWYRLPVRKADAVTVISESTKNDLLLFTNCSEEKIRVIPNFIDPLFQARPKPFSAFPRLLFVGTAPNKNLERALDALVGIEAELLIIGYLSSLQTDSLREKKIRYRLLNNLSDQQMRDMYVEADIMLFPSTYEGFGLPIIEAQATGRPVITSQVEPMMGVAGGAACLVDPYSSESIRNGINKVIEDEPYRNELIEKGFQNVKRFQLENVTRQYVDLYNELIERKGI